MDERASALLSAHEVAAAVAKVAEAIAGRLDEDAVAVCLLTGGVWFAADLTRALATLGRHPQFDALWLTSYGDARESGGTIQVRAGLQRPVAGRQVLLIDDVADTGLSLHAAVGLMRAAGAGEVLSAVFARKPCATPRATEPDFVAWEAPARFLAGYGMDVAGRMRGWPGVMALD